MIPTLFSPGGGQIRSIRSVVNPDKLRHLGPLGDFRSLVEA
jgi:RNA polymerase sigma-70 factor (ECF subfamily)